MLHSFHVITDGKQDFSTVTEIVGEIRDFISYIHIREKQKTARELFDWADQWANGVIDRKQIIINDRFDAAAASQAAGVQLTRHSLPPDAANRIKPPALLIGCSIHSPAEAKEAEIKGADYLLFGHIFPTNSKPGLKPRGLAELERIVEAVSIPVVAIGGITIENAASVLSTGCSGIAVISAVMSAPDPREAAKAFYQVLRDVKDPPKIPWRFAEEHPYKQSRYSQQGAEVESRCSHKLFDFPSRCSDESEKKEAWP